MPKTIDPTVDRTPQGQLAENTLSGVIGYQLAQAEIVTSSNFDARVRGPFDLRPVEFSLIALIKDNPGATPARMAKALAVTAASVTMMVDRLSQDGLVRRQVHTADRRAQHLFLTPEGERVVTESVRSVMQGEAERLAHLTFAERAMLIELLRKVSRARV